MKLETRNSKLETAAGFTLMELMVVIVILGVLIVAGFASFTTSDLKTRDIKRKNDLRQLGVTLEAYYTDKGKYPNSDSNGNILACGATDGTACSWGTQWKSTAGYIYMILLPKDSVTGRNYYYKVGNGNNSYQLYARLENTLDIDVQKESGTNKPYAYSDVACGSANCNFGISSPNTTPNTGRTQIAE